MIALRAGAFSFALFALAGCTLAGTASPSGPGPSGGSVARSGGVENSTGGDRPASTPLEGEGGDISTRVVEAAFDAIGSPYRWGGTSANGFDCSGLIQYAYGQYGIRLPRVSRDQLRRGSPVELSVETLQPGDVLGFSAVVGGEATHVGLYVGDGRFIHSSSSGVRVSDLRTPYWQQHLIAARRMVQWK